MFWIVSFYFAPNIVGDTVFYLGTIDKDPNSFNPTGCFSSSPKNDNGDAGNGQYANMRLKFEANRSNSIFSKSSTVQPLSIRTIFIIKF